MADYYTEASFVIPCSKEEAETAAEAVQYIDEKYTDFVKQIISKKKDDIFNPMDLIIWECFHNHPDREDDGDSLEWVFSVEIVSDGLRVYADDSINTEHAAVFTQAVLNAFNIPYLVEISAAHTCSEQLSDAFGGHACIVTKDYIRWSDFHDFMEAERKAHKDRERYFMCDLTEFNGEYEYTSHFLMKCLGKDDPEQRLNEIFVNYRGDGNKERDGTVWYSCGTGAKNPNLSEITPYEFKVMQAYLSVL